MKSMLSGICIIAALSCSMPAGADIYRLDGDDEVISFTDSPQDRRYQLVIREPQSRGKVGSSTGPAAVRQPAAAPLRMDVAPSGRVLPIEGVITSRTGLRTDPFNGRLSHHNGYDIAAPSGTPVKPVASGIVIFSGWKSGYGNTVIVEHPDGMVTLYAHHASNSVSEGAVVDMKTIIAQTGSTGRSTGPHLHFEAWQNGANITADFFPAAPRGQTGITLAKAPIRRFLQTDGTILFTNLR